MNYSFKNILITGCTGLLGSWMAESLLKSDITIKGVALNQDLNFLLKSKGLLNEFEIKYLDIADKTSVDDYLKNNDFDAIVHLAAQTQVIEAIEDPIRTFKSNIQGTWNLVDSAMRKNLPIVVASSDKAYGDSEVLPYEENFPLNGIYPYEFSKSATDMMCKTYRTTYNLPVTVLRCGNIYGGGDLNWDRLIPGVIKWLINNETPVLRSDGNYKRDWVYVEDVVNAYLKVTNALVENGLNVSDSYNFSSTDYLSVMEVYEKINEIHLGKYVEPIIENKANLEIKDQYLSSEKIFNELGIKSEFEIDAALEMTINWYKENL
jgi:CDP-glucose 4,6-dehydratase